jgi:DNA-binding CsgD family transcriptional regulator
MTGGLFHKSGIPQVPDRSYDAWMNHQAMMRSQRRIAELVNRGLDLVTFWRECTEAITPVLPHYLTPCWFTLDPASLLVTSHFEEGLPEIPHEWLAQEYFEDDFNKMADVARSDRGVATLHEATGGEPSNSLRYRNIMVDYGAEQEMIAALRTQSGEVWGSLGLYREPADPMFGEGDLDFVQALAPSLAEGARRALLFGEAGDPEGPEAPGLIVLADDWSVESMTPGTARWLAEFPDGAWENGRLPSAVYAVAGQAKHNAGIRDPGGQTPFARVLSVSGRWIVLHGAALASDRMMRIAVIVEPAHPARITPLLMSVYQLTEREQDVSRLVLQGASTADIAESLFISVHTVQQHLKNVFDKTGVRSRRDLVAKIFFSHYEPRVRDNEQRAVQGKPLRGGPMNDRA